ncbi:MAG: four helix bundle protein [Chitinophagaceae bacterium]
MPTVSKFEDLEIWKMSRIQAQDIFLLTQHFKNDYALINQINAAAGSVMDNIAEGFERFSAKEFCQFLVISKGSNGEVRSQLYRAFDRAYITIEFLNGRLAYAETLGRKINSLIIYLKKTEYKKKQLK